MSKQIQLFLKYNLVMSYLFCKFAHINKQRQKNMRIILDNGGQTCNKFWCYLAPIESAIKGKKRYSVLFPDKDIEDFPNLLNCHYLHFMFSCVILRKIFGLKKVEILLRKYIKKFRILDIIIKLRPNMLWESWKDCHFIIEETTRPYIQKIFRPKESIVDSVEDLFYKVRKDCDLIIGVHIRRGDYKDFCNGAFYFSFDKYREICDQIQDEFSGKRCVFFLSSNENVDESSFEGIKHFSIPDGKAAHDLYGLSICDYIIATHSSFSQWASFYGEVPIKLITKNGTTTTSFRKIIALDKYETGETVETLI